MHHNDPVLDYRRAINVTLDWERTAAQTQQPRHYQTAAVCRQIAVERARAALARQLSEAERLALRRIEQEAQLETRLDASRLAIAESLELLNQADNRALRDKLNGKQDAAD